MNKNFLRMAFLALAVTLLGSVSVVGQVIYDSTVSPQPGNLPSVGAEAYAFKEIGDNVTFAGTYRRLYQVTVTLSSWGCEDGAWNTSDCVTTPGATFNIPITLKIYNAGDPTPGSQIATVTETFTVPYRPSADLANCTGGRWYQASTGTCFNGLAHDITFNLYTSNITVPNSVVYGVEYNTTSYGPNPIGTGAPCFSTNEGCFYDSLNVALAPVVTVGTKMFPDTLYWNNLYASNYCDNGLAGTGTFRLDSPTVACWVGYVPAAQFIASNPPLAREDCKNYGWRTRTYPNGDPFPNQGKCVQFVNTGFQ